ncbi:hypothetical protein [Trichothermofontia sp.]
MPQPRKVELLAIGLCGLGACTVIESAILSLGQDVRSLATIAPAPQTHPSPPSVEDPWATAGARATLAATLAQTAQTPTAWAEVAQAWLGAIAALQHLKSDDPRWFFAQKKQNEYLRNFLYAQQQATRGTTPLISPSFGSQRLDEQLTLYLSYVATIGPPDILIVGSSRALQGIDPQVLQQGLAAQGTPGLQVFNLGINGATAQVVDVLLRQILPPAAMPRLLLWADGLRAFNSGRRDRTYEALVRSPGYQQLSLTGEPLRLQPSSQQPGSIVPAGHLLACDDCLAWAPLAVPLATALAPTASGGIVAKSTLDANGFLAIPHRFDPTTYFRQHPRVAGLYDGDYAALNFGGPQAAAFDRVLALSRARQIPLVLVNLPLTEIYLDATRSRAEQQFAQTWQARASRDGFHFRDYARRWPQNHAFFDDPSHLNQWGAAAIAQLLAHDRSLPWPQVSTLKPE